MRRFFALLFLIGLMLSLALPASAARRMHTLESLWVKTACFQPTDLGPDRVYTETLLVAETAPVGEYTITVPNATYLDIVTAVVTGPLDGQVTLTLGPTYSWNASPGPADCVADVGHFQVAQTGLLVHSVEGTTTFHVDG